MPLKMSLTIHKTYQIEPRPVGLVNYGINEATGTPDIREERLKRRVYRCFPETAKDVLYLRLLDRSERFAPATGSGILVDADKIDQLAYSKR